MRILYSHRTRSADGQYVHIRSLTDALASRGHEVFMCGPDETGGDRMLDAGGAANSPRLPRRLYEIAEFGYSAVGYRRLAAMEKRVAPDILYERYNLYYHAGVRLARARRLPLILEVNAPLADERARHGGLGLKPLARWSEQSIWNAAAAVLPVTEVLAEKVRAAGVPSEKITVIHNGVDSSFTVAPDATPIRRRYGLEGKLVLGFSGFVREWHGVDLALEFMAGAERSDLHLLLVGDGPARSRLEEQARSAGLQDRFTVTGVVQRDEMPAHVAAFDIALQPAVVAYASPLKLFEYMALGRAILAPDSANIREILTDGVDAHLFACDNRDEFRKRLAVLSSDENLRVKLGAAAKQTLRDKNLT